MTFSAVCIQFWAEAAPVLGAALHGFCECPYPELSFTFMSIKANSKHAIVSAAIAV